MNTVQEKVFAYLVMIIMLTGIVFVSVAEAQQQPDLFSIESQRLSTERNAMLILLTWGGLNMAGGGLLAATSAKHRDFGLMSAGWGLVNAGIAGYALLSASAPDPSVSFQDVLSAEQLFNRILAVNTGLNVAYIGVGWSMNYMGGKSRTRDFGSAIVVQGIFLLIFDAILLYDSSQRLSELALYPGSVSAMAADSLYYNFPALSLRFSF